MKRKFMGLPALSAALIDVGPVYPKFGDRSSSSLLETSTKPVSPTDGTEPLPTGAYIRTLLTQMTSSVLAA